jgi:adenine-specific DNA-methyltransferase
MRSKRSCGRLEGSVPEYNGRLELTWTNKHLRLLTREDGSYDWVSPSDYRVAEVHLLHDAGTTGEVHSEAERAKDNLLIRGDALSALTSLIKIPEFREEYVGRVKLVYIDPPFNTGQAFEHYDDALEHSVWLTMMRDRLTQLKKLLARDGSIWVHLDDTEMPYCRVLLDEVFGRDSFVATVVWENFYGRSNAAAISGSHNYLLVYSPLGQDWRRVRNLEPREGSKSLKKYKNPDHDRRGPWRNGPIFASEERHEGLMYAVTTPSGRVVTPPAGSHWRMTEEEFWRLADDGRINFGERGENVPALKLFLHEIQDGLVPKTWWPHTEAGHSQEAKREIQALFPAVTPFATPKPERLMERIVQIATNPDEIVLDCFAGSGTTAAVAHKMARRWVAAEWNRDTLERFTGPRLTKVVRGEDPGGVTEFVGWEGGGGFRVLDVAPSMFADDDGHVVLADWAVNGALAEATAAQFGFDYDPEMLPFCGRKGRSRLAVVDGLVNEAVIRILVEHVPEGEALVLCATMVDPAAAGLLPELRRGSRLRKIPDSILADYRRGQLWWESRMAALYAPEVESAIAAADGGAPDVVRGVKA